MNADDFGLWLAERIATIPMTRVEFARTIGISVQTLNCWIYGRSGLRADMVTRVARGLGLSRSAVKARLGRVRKVAA